MKFLIQFLPVIMAAIAAEEEKFAVSQGISLLSAENSRVKAGLSDEQISATVHGLVALGLAEQAALVSHLTANLPAAAATSKKLQSAARCCLVPA